jgi:hypothetical protein
MNIDADNTALAIQSYVATLRRQLAAQRRYIEELEKQLEHAQPGILKEVREYLNIGDAE